MHPSLPPPQRSAFFKGWLPHTLKRAYGVDGAFRIQPPTFSLQLAVDRQRLRAAIDKQVRCGGSRGAAAVIHPEQVPQIQT